MDINAGQNKIVKKKNHRLRDALPSEHDPASHMNGKECMECIRISTMERWIAIQEENKRKSKERGIWEVKCVGCGTVRDVPTSGECVECVKLSILDRWMTLQEEKKKGEEEPEPMEEAEDIDPDEDRYCLCDDVSWGEMISCDNNVSFHTFTLYSFITSLTFVCE